MPSKQTVVAVEASQQICNLQEQVVKFIQEEENLREQKNAAAKEFREQINAIKKERIKLVQSLEELKQSELEREGTVILEAAETKTTAKAS